MRTWSLGKGQWELPPQGGVIGILNVTPDSFSDGGLHMGVEAALCHARRLVEDGADMVDVGGESTGPGSAEVDVAEELQRTIPVVRSLRAEFPQLKISIDTRHVPVAEAALEAGADVVNDITGLAAPAMRALCARYSCGVVLMHMQGDPQTMQLAPAYADVVGEVRDFFERRIRLAEQAGIDPSRICLDPGIGISFGKTTQHNVALISHLEELRVRDLPLLMALSRKRFLGELLHDPQAAKNSPVPTVAASLAAAAHGADLHRVHDVRALRQALTLRHALA